MTLPLLPTLPANLATIRDEDSITFMGLPVRVSEAQPKNVITIRSFRLDGTVLDEKDLFITPHGNAAPRLPATGHPPVDTPGAEGAAGGECDNHNNGGK